MVHTFHLSRCDKDVQRSEANLLVVRNEERHRGVFGEVPELSKSEV